MSNTQTALLNAAAANGWTVYVRNAKRMVAALRTATGWVTVSVTFSAAGTVIKAFRNGAAAPSTGRRDWVLGALAA